MEHRLNFSFQLHVIARNPHAADNLHSCTRQHWFKQRNEEQGLLGNGRGEDSGVGDVGSKLGLADSSAGKGPSLKAIGHSRAGARLEKDGNQGHPRVAG